MTQQNLKIIGLKFVYNKIISLDIIKTKRIKRYIDFKTLFLFKVFMETLLWAVELRQFLHKIPLKIGITWIEQP